MKAPKQILLALTNEAESGVARRQAAELALQYKAALTVVVLQSEKSANAALANTTGLGGGVRRIVSLQPGQRASSLEVQKIESRKDVATAIATAATRRQADWIIVQAELAQRGFAFWRRSPLEELLRIVHVPVWVSRSSHGGDGTYPARIACSVDLGPESLHVVRAAGSLAKHWSAQLAVVHSLPVADESLIVRAILDDLPPAITVNSAQSRVRALLQEAGADGVPVIGYQRPSRWIRSALRVTGSGLLVMSGLPGQARSREERERIGIIRSSPVPVLVIPVEAAVQADWSLRPGRSEAVAPVPAARVSEPHVWHEPVHH